MAISKRSGREYQSRRERGYQKPNSKRRRGRQRYPKGYDRWGQPNTCGVIDPVTGRECPRPNAEGRCRCESHQRALEVARSQQEVDHGPVNE